MYNLINGLECCVDWLEFTILDIYGVSDVLRTFGLDLSSFTMSERGGLGYKASAKHHLESIIVYFDGNDNMGVHMRVSGSSIGYFLDCYMKTKLVYGVWGDVYEVSDFKSHFALLCDDILKIGKFSRIDLAIDDYTDDYYSCDDVVELMGECLCVSKFKKWQNVNTRSIADNQNVGHTVYFGSRTSDVFVRFYDKKKESNVDFRWFRWEIELKGVKSNAVAEMIFNKECLGKISIGILSHYVRFIVNDDINRSRCSLQPIWSKFVSNVEKTPIIIKKKEKTIEDKLEWIETQCMPTLSGLVKYNQGDMTFLYKDLEKHYNRNNNSNKLLYEGVVDYVLQ